MTESLIPFDDVDDDAAPRVRRSVLLAGVGAAIVAGAAAAVLVGGGGADESAEQLVPLSAVVRAPQAQAAAAPAPAGPAAGSVLKVPPQHTEDIARNPFKARYVEPPPPPPPAEKPPVNAPAVPGAAPGTLPLPVALPLPLPGPQAPAPRAPEPVEPVAVEYPITLEAVGDPQGEVRLVKWTIDGKAVEVVPGQRFGRFGELVVLAYVTEDGGKVVKGVLLQVGDANPLTVALEETVKVL